MARRRPRHRGVSKEEWLLSQQQQLDGWSDIATLDTQRRRLHDNYFELIHSLLPPLDESSEIVEIGSGPVCFSQEIAVGHKTFVDPLLDDLRRLYPGAMPKDAVYLNTPAEEIPLPSHCIDVVICMNTLSFSENPEEVLYEVARLLKSDGVLLLAVQISSSLMARAHYFGCRVFPLLRSYTRPYRFDYQAMYHTVSRHLHVDESRSLAKPHPLNLFGDHEYLFICSPMSAEQR
ncbi:MAG: class I SAM-dependent methyltransferase [Mariprofundales bacterium]|nr:class I SAM-dependent methyltransferase [Mariprofundales bacterium]